MIIHHVITRFIRGGADENTLLSCNGQAERGHAVTLIYGDENHNDIISRLHPSVKPICVPSLVRPVNPIKDLAATIAMWRIFRRDRPQIVHTHTSKAGVTGRLAAWLARVPTIIHGVHILPFLNVSALEKWVYIVAERVLAAATHAFIDVSAAMKSACLEYGIGTEANHSVIASGMRIEDFTDVTPIADDELADLRPRAISAWSKGKVIVMAAAFEERKRQVPFIHAFKRVVERTPDAVLLLAGAGPTEPDIAKAIVECGLQDNVSIIGFRQDLGRWIKASTLCVLSSEREGLPRVIVQYALGGSPIVATRLPGLDAVVHEGKTGFTVDEVDQMPEKINLILGDAELLATLRENTRALDLSAWSADTMNQRICEVYDRLAR